MHTFMHMIVIYIYFIHVCVLVYLLILFSQGLIVTFHVTQCTNNTLWKEVSFAGDDDDVN